MREKESRKRFLTVRIYHYAVFLPFNRVKSNIILQLFYLEIFCLSKIVVLIKGYVERAVMATVCLFYNEWKKWARVFFIADMERVIYNQNKNFKFHPNEDNPDERIKIQKIIEMTLRNMSEEDQQIWKLYRLGFQPDEIAEMIALPVDKINRRVGAIRRDLLEKLRN